MVTSGPTEQAVERWQAQLARCIRCGTCRSVCPIFQITGNESTTARGKVKLIDSVVRGQLPLTTGLQQRMGRCLLCKACAAGCPSGVATDELFLAARRALAEKNGLPLAKRIAFTGLTYRRLFDLGLRMGAAFQGLAFRRAPGGRGRVPRIPLPSAGLTARRLIPQLATRTLRARLRGLAPVENPRARVAFFPGCMLTYVYPEAGLAVVEVLRANGVEVTVPERLFCCGAPAFTSGDMAVGQHLASGNLSTLSAERVDAVVTGCASCGSALRQDYGVVIDDPTARSQWAALREKVRDVTQFLAELGTTAAVGPVAGRITYHDPCHLVRGMGVSKEPRKLLRAIPSLELAEMKDAARCCGCGGTFSLTHYELSRKVNDQKLDNAEKTGAGILVTGCPACRMHIEDGLSQRGSTMKVLHTAEVLALAYRAAARDPSRPQGSAATEEGGP
jgi:glycolate oxidase iron-sulfur subunit